MVAMHILSEDKAAPIKSKPARKRLLLLRHAKSAWPEGVEDIARPLADRGRKAAPVMGGYLLKRGLIADLVLMSPARRTQDTWALIRKLFPASLVAKTEPRIYAAASEALLNLVRETDDAIETLLIIGHNPGFEDLARTLLSKRDGDHAERLMEKYPTAGVAVFDFDLAHWADVSPGKGRLKAFVTPKSLAKSG